MASAAPLGAERWVDGVRYVREPQENLPEPKVVETRHFTAQSLPLGWPYAKRHDARGRCQFDSMSEVREAVARANDDGETVVYD